MSASVWGIVIIAAFVAFGVYLVRRTWALRGPTRKPLDIDQRFDRALEDMRGKGIATPEELTAQTEASQELGVEPPDIPGFPQTPEDAGTGRQNRPEPAGERPWRRKHRR